MAEWPKQPSGAQKRKRKAEKEREAVKAKAVEMGLALPEDADDGQGEFSQLGPPPLDSPETALGWVRRYQLTAMHVAATKPLTDSLRERLRFVREFGATIGMTQNRADLEELADRLESSLAGAKQTGIASQTTAVTARPDTSRGGNRSRGPRPIEPNE